MRELRLNGTPVTEAPTDLLLTMADKIARGDYSVTVTGVMCTDDEPDIFKHIMLGVVAERAHG